MKVNYVIVSTETIYDSIQFEMLNFDISELLNRTWKPFSALKSINSMKFLYKTQGISYSMSYDMQESIWNKNNNENYLKFNGHSTLKKSKNTFIYYSITSTAT